MNFLRKEKSLLFSCKDGLLPKNFLNHAFLSGLDWNFVLRTAEVHRILPFLALAFRRAGELSELPPDIRARMEVALQQASLENLIKLSEFQKFNSLFEAHNIPVIPLKGIALTQLIYQESSVRRMGDIDILIKETDLKKIKKLITEMGFKLKEGSSRWQTALSRPLFGRADYIKEGEVIDVQWRPRFFFGGKLIEWNTDRAWQNAFHFSFFEKNVFQLSSLDNIQYLLFQICGDFEEGHLLWIQLLDTALMIKKSGVRWDGVLSYCAFNLPAASKKQIEIFVTLIREIYFEEKKEDEFSPETREITERLLNGAPSASSLFGGRTFLKLATSPRDKIIFVAGYLFPNKGHNYLEHWRRLFLKMLKLVFPDKKKAGTREFSPRTGL